MLSQANLRYFTTKDKANFINSVKTETAPTEKRKIAGILNQNRHSWLYYFPPTSYLEENYQTKKIVKDLHKRTNFPGSIGGSTRRTLFKLSTKNAKKSSKYLRIFPWHFVNYLFRSPYGLNWHRQCEQLLNLNKPAKKAKCCKKINKTKQTRTNSSFKNHSKTMRHNKYPF